MLFARYESLRRLRIAATAPQQVLAASKAADRLTEGVAGFLSTTVKREAPSCGAEASRRPLVACNTLAPARSATWTPKRRRFSLTPHPRKGEEAVKAAGGAVQQLIDAPTPRGSSSDEDVVAEGEAVFSSDEEGEVNDSGSD